VRETDVRLEHLERENERLRRQLAEMTTALSQEVMLRQIAEQKLAKSHVVSMPTPVHEELPYARAKKVDARRRPDEPPEEAAS